MPVALTEIQEEFRAQLGFLKKSCDAYDSGELDEFRRIAIAVRILVYDKGQSRSLSDQLGLKAIKFFAYSIPIDTENLVTSMPLVRMLITVEGGTYLPCLDQGFYEHRSLPFDTWWGEEAFRSPGGVSMARSGFILHTANQAGGAHVDPELDEEFHKIAKANEAGWVSHSNDVAKPMADLEKAYVRHIGFEILQTLAPEWDKILGNRLCKCGNGRKFRYCHGKPN